MKVILKQAVDRLGEAGEVVKVKAGFARNFLLPQGLAYEASEANVRRLEEERALQDERAKRDYLEARRRASRLEGLVLTFKARAGEEGKLFGSVTSADIADRANEQGLDFEIDRKQVELAEPIKSIGAFEVPIRLHAEVKPGIEIRVERDEG